MGGKVKVIDHGLEKFVETLRSLRGKRVRVGIMGPQADATGTRGGKLTNVELATIHENGARIDLGRRVNSGRTAKDGSRVGRRATAIIIPARPFLRPVADERREHWQRRMREESEKAVRERRDPRRALYRVGEEFRRAVIERVKAHVSPPLVPATVARKKGESIPLIDTGSMIGVISVVVG